MNYITIRTENGTLKAKLTGRHMSNIMNDVEGHWGKIHWQGENRKTCFYVDADAEYVSQSHAGCLVVNITKGDIIEEKSSWCC